MTNLYQATLRRWSPWLAFAAALMFLTFGVTFLVLSITDGLPPRPYERAVIWVCFGMAALWGAAGAWALRTNAKKPPSPKAGGSRRA